jgi:large subunit ribosomal protein L31
MKSDIHPTYFPQAHAICGCGKKYTLGSTQEKIEVEICANCHPFFTGKEKLIDTAGKVEKFKARRKAAAETTTKEKKPRKSNKKA